MKHFHHCCSGSLQHHIVTTLFSMISLECLLQCDITTGIIQGRLTAVGYFAVSTFEIIHVIDNTMMIPGAMKAV